jgi:hypothetical protein
LVTNLDQYRTLVASLQDHGFTADVAEFIYIDNSRSNRLEAFAACNRFLELAKGEYVILCHQDISLLADGRERLDACIRELEDLDDTWALCGNAGRRTDGTLVTRISDPYGDDQRSSLRYPVRVMSLDENFIVAKKRANLALSRDLQGFHWYGAEMALMADMLGHSAYVIDFHLRHLSAGVAGESFFQLRRAFQRKYHRSFRSRWMYTTVSKVFLTGNPLRLAAARVQLAAETLLDRLGRGLRGSSRKQ